jgi:hypothetical protein
VREIARGEEERPTKLEERREKVCEAAAGGSGRGKKGALSSGELKIHSCLVNRPIRYSADHERERKRRFRRETECGAPRVRRCRRNKRRREIGRRR